MECLGHVLAQSAAFCYRPCGRPCWRGGGGGGGAIPVPAIPAEGSEEEDGPLPTEAELLAWCAPEHARAKVSNLALIIRRERWSACALQEVPTSNSIAAYARDVPALATWVFVTSSVIGQGLYKMAEAAVFAYDATVWEQVGGVEVYAPPVAATLRPFMRNPAVLFLRSRVHAPRTLALVSVHLKSYDGSNINDIRNEAAALGLLVRPAGSVGGWVEALAKRHCPSLEAASDLAIAVCGDMNLAPPSHGGSRATRPDAAWDALVAPGAHGGGPFVSTISAGPSTIYTTTKPRFTRGTIEQEYDNVFLRVPWVHAPGVAHAVDITGPAYSALAGDVAQLADAMDSLPAADASPHVRSIVMRLRGVMDDAGDSAQAAFLRFRHAFSDHLPVCVAVVCGREGAAGGAAPLARNLFGGGQ